MPYSANTAMYGPRYDLLGALHSTAKMQSYVATQVLPKLTVFERTGQYTKVLNSKAYRLLKTKRAAGQGFARVATPIDSGTFLCEERGVEESVDRVNKAVYRSVMDQDMVAARTAYNVMRIDRENDVASAIYNETTFPASGTTGLTVGTPWSTAASATPIADINTGKNAIIAKVGMGRFALVANDKVIRNLWNTANVRNQMVYGYGRPIEGEPKLDVLANVLGVDKIIQASATYNSANANATATMSRIWSDTYAFLARISDSQALDEPQLGRTFVNTVVYEESGDDQIVVGDIDDPDVFIEVYQDKPNASTIARVREFVDEVILDSNCGFLFKTVT